ncbi:RIP metalloprotease RseP [Elusimicrobiota bacterium]
MITSVLSIFITFSIVVFVHELGHFVMAIKTGVKVYVFSLGFGPELIGFTRNGIRYRISLIPMGGYVKMKGENPEDDDARADDAFMGLDPLKRLLVIIAGPFMNFVTGMFIFSLIIYLVGLPKFVDKPIIGQVAADSPAYVAGIQSGDVVISVNNKNVSTWHQLSEYIGSSEKGSVNIVIDREGEVLSFDIIPRMDEEIGRVLIGITATFENVKHGLFISLYEGIKYTIVLCLNLLVSLWLMLTGKIAAAVAGPVGIAKLVTQAAGEGTVYLFQWIALISVNLGFINLFPIPILDGGHVVFAVIEKIKGKPIDPKKVNIANVIGLSLILTLLIFVTWKDIVRAFFR